MKKLIKKILDILNVHPDENQKYLLAGVFVSGLLITYVNPTITKAIISELPAQWLAIESLVMALSGLLVGMVWKGKIRDKALKWFNALAIAESLAGFVLGMYLTFISYNVWLFAVASLIYSSFITTFVGKCIMAFRSKLWQEKEREIYDNNKSIVGSVVCIIGFSLALVALPPLKVATFLWACCCIIDDIAWIYVYNKNKAELRNIE